MGADPETLSRLKQMQVDDEDEEGAETKDKGSKRKDKTRNDTVKYSDEEDEDSGLSQEDLQVGAVRFARAWSAGVGMPKLLNGHAR